MRNRSRVEIMGIILDVINGSDCFSKSQIMYKAILSYAQTREYMETLADSDLLLYDLTTQTYKLTENGVKFLQIYNEMSDMMNLSELSEQGQYQAHILEAERERGISLYKDGEDQRHKRL
jgi:predicted transcriptional regulator